MSGKIERPQNLHVSWDKAGLGKWFKGVERERLYALQLEAERDTLLKRIAELEQLVSDAEERANEAGAELHRMRETSIAELEPPILPVPGQKVGELRGHNPDLPLHLVVSDEWEALTQRVKALEDKLGGLIKAHNNLWDDVREGGL